MPPLAPPPPSPAPPLAAPTFYLTGRQTLGPGSLLLATLLAAAALSVLVYAMDHARHTHILADIAHAASGSPDAKDDDKDDDPNQVDTIVLGDPADAPVPARKGNHVSPVHPTILVRLPRYGDQTGLIPDSPTGHLLYAWLAAFNQSSGPALVAAVPTVAPTPSAAAQLQLRQLTGGFNLLSAKEVQPGLLVFRLRDQTREATEALGTLQMRPDSSPAAIASFSLRSVPAPSPAPSQSPTPTP